MKVIHSSRTSIMSNDYVKVQRRPLMELLTCHLCRNLYREATTICVCLHTFCKQCIYQILEEDKRNHCPVCNAYLGSFPEELLRNDHNLRKLVTQIFPLEMTMSGEGRPAASSVKIKKAEPAAPTLTEANAQNQDFSLSSEAKRISDERDVAGFKFQLNQTGIKSSNHSINAIKKQNELAEMEMSQIASVTSEPIAHAFCLKHLKKGSCWEHLAGHEEGETNKSILNKIYDHAQVRRRRRTKRKPCRFVTGQKEEDSKIETKKEVSEAVPSGLGCFIDSGKRCGETLSRKVLPGYPPRPVWFCLLACQEKKSMALPQIPKPFISTKNGNFAVSFVNKYLAKKLNINNESEVEVMCFGHPLIPTLTLNNLIDMWLEAVSKMGPVYVNCHEENGNGGNFVMELTYRRTKKQRALQSKSDLMQP